MFNKKKEKETEIPVIDDFIVGCKYRIKGVPDEQIYSGSKEELFRIKILLRHNKIKVYK